MILQKLYVEPAKLFEPIVFEIGINYVFGKKEKISDTKKSLNGIGKSTFLDMIDFCLLSSHTAQHNKRLYAAYEKNILKGATVFLDFRIEKNEYTISRSFDNPNMVQFNARGGKVTEYPLNDMKKYLCTLIFAREVYDGYFSDAWFRKLMPFYIKVQKPKKAKFLDPIPYIKELSVAELNQYHLFFMNINNSLSHQNFKIQIDLKRIEPAIKEIKRFIEESYGLKNIPEASSKLKKLQMDIESLEKQIKLFELKESYKDSEEQANELTSEIKRLWFENYLDRKKIESYSQTLSCEIDISIGKIKNLYSEFNVLFAEKVKKTLQDAINFRKNLNNSRKEFLEEEIRVLNNKINKREESIEEKQFKRKKVFNFLSSEKAIEDLTEAFDVLGGKKNELNNISSQVKLYQDFSKEKNQIELEEKRLDGLILDFKDTIKKNELEFSKVFTNVHNTLYPKILDNPMFDISVNLKKDSKLEINVLTNNEMFSKGKNAGRTLIYDLAILFYGIGEGINMPRFLIHDGIFDGMDKAHFIQTYKFLDEMKVDGKEFQYIVTINEEGELTENFGEADLVTKDKIEEAAILVLTPAKKFLGNF